MKFWSFEIEALFYVTATGICFSLYSKSNLFQNNFQSHSNSLIELRIIIVHSAFSFTGVSLSMCFDNILRLQNANCSEIQNTKVCIL